ncbi:hypothetical protein Slin15195_G123450 [Septoria linicola]|uniref:Uncharacterized protein n=1 Tax=Septoria linicola TaxID=215465 RepID=A0A9Q9EPQ9_9PEZI|nr:hypothetical protein Slin14017_G079650 [Septoria linicola]USW59026.1 hypothetical protein Slin15195_G123450 [Septoria linicola]
MPSRITLLAVLAAIVAIFLSPQIASVSHTIKADVKAPAPYVREKALEYSFVRGALLTGSVPIDALLLKRDEHTFGAAHATRNEYLQVEVPGSGRLRGAKVIRNRPRDFAYREDLPYGQRIVHTLQFVTLGEGKTSLRYEKKWKGSLAVYALGKAGYVKVMEGSKGGLEGLGDAIEQAYEEEKDTWGSARYD